MLARTGQALVLGAVGFPCIRSKAAPDQAGAVIGNPIGEQIGRNVLAEGGNAVDAAVAAALAACIASPDLCGIGGYGGHLMFAPADGGRVSCIDFNTAASAAARPDMFAPAPDGKVKNAINQYGWLAPGVPGTIAGLHMALEKHGTRSFREIVQPAIRLAREGIVPSEICAKAMQNFAARLKSDPGSAKLYFPGGRPLAPGEKLRNPDLAELLSTLAERNSVESFYRGDIALRIADAFQSHGGLVTASDLAAYHARAVRPPRQKFPGFELFTAPPGAAGLSVLEALSVVEGLNWNARKAGPQKTHALLESLRLAWKDRFELFGDPEKVKVPVERLLSSDYTRGLAARADHAAASGKVLEIKIDAGPSPGTVNLASADRHGNVAAVTLTHGGAFGAQVTVDGLGLTLGHGMFKFNTYPLSPNAPGPGKRPVHNMSPTIARTVNKTTIGVGAAGSQLIPNAVFSFLLSHMFDGKSFAESVAAPRLHTVGMMDATFERTWPEADRSYLQGLGFKIHLVDQAAHLSAVSFNGPSGEIQSARR